MAGFDNEVMYANNVDFTGSTTVQGRVTSNGQLLIGSSVSPNIRVGTLTAGPGVTIANAPGAITISAPGAAFTWVEVTSADNPVTLQPSYGYIPKGAGVVNFQFPFAPNLGDTYVIAGYGNLWTLTVQGGQSIYFGNHAPASSLTATNVGDTVSLVCVTPLQDFKVLSSIGNITIA